MNALRSTICVVALCAGAATVLAQTPQPPAPVPPPQPGSGSEVPPDHPPDHPPDNPPTNPPRPVAPIRPSDPMGPPSTQPMHEVGDRPEGFSIGIGLGYRFPGATLDTPNITSVRFRFPSGLTLEPLLVLAQTSHTVDTGMAVTDEVSELGIGALARFPVMKKHRTDLEVVGALNVDQLDNKPNEPDMKLTITTTNVSYGVAVGAWLSRHWQISFTATNSLIDIVKNRQEMGVGTVTVTTNSTYGLVFAPKLQLMIHLYN